MLSETTLFQVVKVDPKSDPLWKSLKDYIKTDEVHAKDRLNTGIETPGRYECL